MNGHTTSINTHTTDINTISGLVNGHTTSINTISGYVNTISGNVSNLMSCITISVANNIYTINIGNATSKVFINGTDITIGSSSLSTVRVNGDLYHNNRLLLRTENQYNNNTDFEQYIGQFDSNHNLNY